MIHYYHDDAYMKYLITLIYSSIHKWIGSGSDISNYRYTSYSLLSSGANRIKYESMCAAFKHNLPLVLSFFLLYERQTHHEINSIHE